MSAFSAITKNLIINDVNKKIINSACECAKLTICYEKALTISLIDNNEVLFVIDSEELLELQKFINFALSDKTDD